MTRLSSLISLALIAVAAGSSMLMFSEDDSTKCTLQKNGQVITSSCDISSCGTSTCTLKDHVVGLQEANAAQGKEIAALRDFASTQATENAALRKLLTALTARLGSLESTHAADHGDHDKELKDLEDAYVATDTQLQNSIDTIARTPGPKGDAGKDGATGAKGETGATGATGAKGETGEQGTAAVAKGCPINVSYLDAAGTGACRPCSQSCGNGGYLHGCGGLYPGSCKSCTRCQDSPFCMQEALKTMDAHGVYRGKYWRPETYHWASQGKNGNRNPVTSCQVRVGFNIRGGSTSRQVGDY